MPTHMAMHMSHRHVVYATCLWHSVEDTKGNNGERGELCVTNLRIVWSAHRSK